MSWLVVVIFATFYGDIYVFTEPTFDSRDECMTSVLNPADIKNYTDKLLQEYGEPMPILGINCLQEDEIKRLLEGEMDISNPV